MGSCEVQKWRSAEVEQCRSGAVQKWSSGAVEQWSSGEVEKWSASVLRLHFYTPALLHCRRHRRHVELFNAHGRDECRVAAVERLAEQHRHGLADEREVVVADQWAHVP